MEESDVKKQYEQVLALYSRKRSQCQQMDRHIPLLRTEIQELKLQIQSFVPQPVQKPQTQQQSEQERQQLIQQYQELTSQLNRLELQINQNNDPVISTLNQELKQLQEINAQAVADINRKELQALHQLQNQAQQKLSQIQRDISSNQKDILTENQKKTALQQQLSQLEILKGNQSKNENQIDPEHAKLENQLKKIEQEEKDLAEALKKEENLMNEKKKKQEENNKAQHEELNKIKKKNSTLQSTLDKLEQEYNKLGNDSNKKPVNEGELKQLENLNKNLNREIDALKKQLEVKKTEKAKKQEQAKKERNKEKKSHKNDLAEEQTKNELLLKQLDREKTRLQGQIKLRKSYVSQESLTILQKEYQRHQLKNKPNLELEEKKREKLNKQREVIKSRIDFLLNSSREMEKDSQIKLKEQKQKGDELVKDKLNKQKQINQVTYKLNQYMNVFPDHEQKKEEIKAEERRKKQQARDKLKVEQQKEKENMRKKKEKQKEEKVLIEDKTSWQEWNQNEHEILGKKDTGSFYNNKQFQLVAAALAFIGVLTLSFGG